MADSRRSSAAVTRALELMADGADVLFERDTFRTNGSGTLFKWKGLNPDGPVRWVILKADKLSIRAGKSLWAYTLGEATQGSVALRFQAGSGPVWCAQAGQSGFPPKIDMPDKFIAMKKTPAPAVCP